jgi:hypothetical protein
MIHSYAKHLTSILGEDGAQFIPRDSAAYPLLQHHLVPLSDPRVHESLLRELYKLNQERIKTKTIELQLVSSGKCALVTIPRCQDLRRNSRCIKYNFADEIIKGIDPNGEDTDKKRRRFLEFVMTERKNVEICRDLCCDLGYSSIQGPGSHPSPSSPAQL